MVCDTLSNQQPFAPLVQVYRQLWHALRQRVLALDELAMCTMRLRLRYPGETIRDDQFYIIDQTQVGIDVHRDNSVLLECRHFKV